MRFVFLLLFFLPIGAGADSYTVEIKDPEGTIEAHALWGAATLCGRSAALTLEQRLEMKEIKDFYSNRAAQQNIDIEYSLAMDAAHETFGEMFSEFTGNPSYQACANALHQ